MFDAIANAFTPGFEHLDWRVILLAELLAFALAAAIAKTYPWTHRGLSWSPSFVQALVLGAPVSAMLMLAIGDNFAAAIGVIGSLAVIRFRTNLRDPRDMLFVFASLGVGVATGLQAFTVAIIAGAVFVGAVWVLALSSFGEGETHDGILRFQMPPGDSSSAGAVLRRHARLVELLAVREIGQGSGLEYAYQIALRRRGAEAEAGLIADLARLEGLSGLSWHAQQAPVEG